MDEIKAGVEKGGYIYHDCEGSPELVFIATGVNPIEVMVEQEIIWANGTSTRVDANEIRAKAAEQAKKVHARLAEIV